MEILRFDPSVRGGVFKPLNAVNGGPWHKRHANDQYHSNLKEYTAAHIPFSRNHDSNFCDIYGGPYAHDVSAIFPDFDADPRDPAAYDFACTDEAILAALDAGTRTFFRLGESIEHQIKKHATLPPKDFHKWAVICEHIIRHYTEGWADGYRLDMPYWEIWNEPDLDTDTSENKRTWGGTRAQFFDFFEIAAKHLKSCFPHLKIGGPALAHKEDWADAFLGEMRRREVPLDFFSWHGYGSQPVWVQKKAVIFRGLLDKYGYTDTESIFDEWNYISGWTEDFVPSLECIHGMTGAAYIMATICLGQVSPIDMMMYYDTRPSVFNGVFDFYTARPLPGYYPLYWYGMLRDMAYEVPAQTAIDGIYTLCGAGKDGKLLAAITYYTTDAAAAEKTFRVDFGRAGEYEVCRLDDTRVAPYPSEERDAVFTMKPNSCLLIREK